MNERSGALDAALGRKPVNALVDLQRDGAIAIVAVDSPPVNALKQAVRAGVADAMKTAEADSGVEAIVLVCRGRTFFAGADITEFGKPPVPPGLHDVIALIEGLSKPVVAAIHGTALGGGLELALGCHYRVAVASAKLGLPEVKLGILPGAGGTQRLPRAVGAEKALRMIVSGDPIGAAEAHREGLVDAIAEGDLVTDAVAFARRVAGTRPLPRMRDQDDKLAQVDRTAFDKAAADLTKKARGLKAPHACVEAVRLTLDTPFDQGLARERELFMELVAGEQSKAQRHVFFAEREAAKLPDMPKGTKERPVNRAAVIGAGTMGGGIAMSLANAGVPVTLIETNEDALKRGLSIIEKNYRATAARGGMSNEDVERRIGLIQGRIGLEAAADADLVIEAVFENMDLKKQIFGTLDRVAKPGAVLASNTSTLDVDEIASATTRPGDVLGMHFFSPANVMKLLEIVRAKATSFDALQTAIAIGRRMGKVPAVVGVCDGFVGNRMLHKRTKEAERLLLEGALPQDVDAAVVEFGFPMGPYAMGDLAGLDVGWRIRQHRGDKAPVSDALCEAGRYGQKTSAGYYRYEAGSRTPVPDPEVERLIAETQERMGITPRKIDKQEIIERMIYPMINEGARILEEGIALRPSDIDVVWVYGYGWPVWRGGPMHYADQVGLAHIRDRLAFYAERAGDPGLEPAALLNRLAASGQGFASLGLASEAAA
jgi:3-hydroxyacyl-CoA dehydrogenase